MPDLVSLNTVVMLLNFYHSIGPPDDIAGLYTHTHTHTHSYATLLCIMYVILCQYSLLLVRDNQILLTRAGNHL